MNDPALKEMLTKMTEELKTPFKDVEGNELTLQATMLDPRFNKYGFTDNTKYSTTYTALVCSFSGFTNISFDSTLNVGNINEDSSIKCYFVEEL